MSDISPYKIQQAMVEAGKLRAEIGDDDPRLLADTIEGETDVFEIIDRLAEAALADKALVTAGKERLQRIEARAERARSTIFRMMEALGLTKCERPLVTVTIAAGAKSAHIVDQSLIPEGFWRRAIDKIELLRALKNGPVPGAELSNGAAALRLLSK